MDENEIPDFSSDDFADDEDILRNRAGKAADQQLIDDALALFAGRFSIKPAISPNPGRFLLCNKSKFHVLKSFRGTVFPDKTLFIILAEYLSSAFLAHSHGTDEGINTYLFGMVDLRRNWPHTTIARETVADRVVDIFTGVDIDFNNSPQFSRKFHVISEDSVALTDLLQHKPLDTLARFSDLELEIKGNYCIFRISRKPVAEHQASVLADAITVISRVMV